MRRILIVLGAVAFAFLLCFGLWNQFGYVFEETLPDRYDFGRVYEGSRVEFSARFLTSARKHPLDQLFEKIEAKLSPSWRAALDKFHPKNFRAEPAVVPGQDLSAIKPKIIAPAFVRVESSHGDQRHEWYGGKTFVVMAGHVDTGRTGEFSGEIEVRWKQRKAFLPVSITVAPAPSGRRVLITETPFDSDATENGTNFLATTELLARLPLKTDLLEALPERLSEYETILLAGGTLARMKPEQMESVKSFVRQGGRLVLACNAFFGGTIPAANKIVNDFGLQVLDQESTKTTITNVVADALTREVRSVTLYRPSPIEVDAARAKLLLTNPDGTGYAAVARVNGGGEVIILTQSLWWWWLQQYRGESDNSRLMQNILER